MSAAFLVAACVVATGLAASRASTLRRRAGVIGRVRGGVPPTAPPVRSALLLVRDAPRLVTGAVARWRAESQYDTTLVVALDAIGRSVRSGASLPQAVSEAATSVRGPVATDLVQVVTSAARGRPFAEALADWRTARVRASVRLTVGALVLASNTGGPPARVIEDVASAIRTRQQVAREAHALAAQARMSALVVGIAPVGFMLVMCATDPRNAHLLFGTPIGLACVFLGGALDAIGAAWMHRMSARVVAA